MKLQATYYRVLTDMYLCIHMLPPPRSENPPGKRPERSLAAYGAYLRSLPFSNEQGLRMVIGGAVREAAARGVVLRPLFSYYSFHG
jgi:hypothetical protein